LRLPRLRVAASRRSNVKITEIEFITLLPKIAHLRPPGEIIFTAFTQHSSMIAIAGVRKIDCAGLAGMLRGVNMV
jgi:hypothetical protein